MPSRHGRALRPIDRALFAAAAALAIAYAIAFVVTAIARLAYPYELDPLEGGVLAMSSRVLHGQPLYARPSIDYAPFCYGPLYFYVAAGAMRALGEGYLALRLVSIVATVATASTIVVVLRKAGVRRPLAWIAAAVLFGAHARTHLAGDVGRVDALALALGLGALAVACSGARTLRNALIAGALGGLAVLAKQPMAVLVAVAIAHRALTGARGQALAMAAAAAAAAAAMLAAMGLLGDPWLAFYCLDVPASHHLRGWDLAVLGPIFVATTLPIAIAFAFAGERLRARLADPWTQALLAYLAMSLFARAKEGGAANVFLPLVAIAAIALGRGAERTIGRAPRATLAAIAAQLAVLVYSPVAIWPTAADRARGDAIVRAIARLPGDVYVPAFPAYATFAGKPWHAHYVALCDLARIDPALRAELAAKHFDAILPVDDLRALDQDERARCDVPDLDAGYAPAGAIANPDDGSLFAQVHAGKLGAIVIPP